MYKYAGIVINQDSINLDKIFTYAIPKEMQNLINVGYRVKVPFGRGNKLIDGFVIELYENLQVNIKGIKNIKKVCDKYNVLRKEDIKLIEIMKKKYLSTYIECIRAIIPSAILKNLKNKVQNVICVKNELSEKFLKENYLNIYNIVKNNNGIYNKTNLCEKYNLSMSSINTMIKHGFLEQRQKIINRYNDREYKEYAPKILNKNQKECLEYIIRNDKKINLIHGVTGSGKTEIYMHLVKKVMEEGKDSIILVPEIALTPQMVERFKGRFGKDIAIFHSKLSDGERLDEWMRVKEGKVRLAIGARSAIFLPFNNLGLIVIDEEHEGSYKSDSNPKYDTREIAEIKSNIEGCKVILGSATPDIETYYRTKDIGLFTLKDRVEGVKLPKVSIVDMREELKQANYSIFSRDLFDNIKEALKNEEQVILFLNRRGFSTFVSCRECGYVFKCNNCDVSLTYHREGNYLSCHYCGSRQKAIRSCPKCGSRYVKYFGIGTERVEKEIRRYFPEAKVLRMDFDTTRKKNSYEEIYMKFKNKKADILIGTQMVAKGLDFKDVTLVGVLAADLSLNLPDYKSAERTFQLITQVSGRAGRGEKEGKVIVQTYNSEHYAITCAVNNDYNEFYNTELNIRENMNYPPYSKMMIITMSSKNENRLIKNIQNVAINLKKNIKNNDKISLLGPCPCSISKIKENYRWQMTLKGDIDEEIALNIKKIVYNLSKDVYNDVKISIDIN